MTDAPRILAIEPRGAVMWVSRAGFGGVYMTPEYVAEHEAAGTLEAAYARLLLAIHGVTITGQHSA